MGKMRMAAEGSGRNLCGTGSGTAAIGLNAGTSGSMSGKPIACLNLLDQARACSFIL